MVIFSFIIAQAQNGKVTGKVLNNKNEPLSGATVKLLGAARWNFNRYRRTLHFKFTRW